MGRKLVKKGPLLWKSESRIQYDVIIKPEAAVLHKMETNCHATKGKTLCARARNLLTMKAKNAVEVYGWSPSYISRFMLVDPSHNPCFFKGNRNWAWSKKACSQRSFEGNRKVNRISHTFNNLLSFVLRFGSGTFWSDMCNSFQY